MLERNSQIGHLVLRESSIIFSGSLTASFLWSIFFSIMTVFSYNEICLTKVKTIKIILVSFCG